MSRHNGLRVISSSSVALRSGNPYAWGLARELTARGAEVREFDGSAVSRWDADVVLVHWPEAALREPQLGSALVGLFKTMAKLVIARMRGIPVVWTVHNLHPHDGLHPALERLFWPLFLPLVSAHISLSRHGRLIALARFPRIGRKPGAVIRHPHYRGLYPVGTGKTVARAMLGLAEDRPLFGCVGTISSYKGTADLVRAFAAARELRADLLVAGKAASAELERELRLAASDDARIHLRLERIPDDRLTAYFEAADIIVLPYRQILNSGTALLALSLDRPVLVPDLGAMPDLRDSEGANWVRLYEPGELGAAELGGALDWALTARGSPPLEGRSWSEVGQQTFDFLRAVSGHSTP